jgi:hypothetical protein
MSWIAHFTIFEKLYRSALAISSHRQLRSPQSSAPTRPRAVRKHTLTQAGMRGANPRLSHRSRLHSIAHHQTAKSHPADGDPLCTRVPSCSDVLSGAVIFRCRTFRSDSLKRLKRTRDRELARSYSTFLSCIGSPCSFCRSCAEAVSHGASAK